MLCLGWLRFLALTFFGLDVFLLLLLAGLTRCVAQRWRILAHDG